MAEPDLVVSAGFSDSQLVKDANKIVAMYRKKGDEAQKAFVDAQGKVTNTQAADAHKRELDKLAKAYDPVYRAAKQYEAEVKRLDRALDIGAVSQKQYTALVEAAAAKMKQAQAIMADTAAVAGGKGGGMRGNIQNLSFQVQDFAVQVAAGTAASTALGQQLPQLLGGFGALGAVLGAVVAVGVPLAAMFLGSKKEAVDLDKSVKELTAGLEALREAHANAALPVEVLTEKYGALADEMARVFQNQLAIAAQELAAMGAAIQSAIADTADLSGMVKSFDDLKAAEVAGVVSHEEYLSALRRLEEQFGFTAAQALQYQSLMDAVSAAQGPEQQAQAWLAVNGWIEANRESLTAQGVAVDDLIRQSNDLAAGYGNAHAAAADTTAAAEAGAIATDNWAAAATNLAANLEGAAGAAGRAAAAVGAAIAAQNKAAGFGNIGGLDPFSASAGRALTVAAGGTSFADQGGFDRAQAERVAAAEEALRKAEQDAAKAARAGGGKAGGGGKRSGGGGREKEPANIFESAERDITNLERQITLLGKSSEETARLQAQWEMLDAAKKAGIPVNDELNAKIGAQAEEVARLTAELERAEIGQKQFDQAVDGIANAFSNAILEGENLRDSLASIFKQIAANILNAGIQQAISSALGGAGGGGGFLGSILSAAFGGTKKAVPSYDGGGFTWSGPRAGGLDGKGGRLAMLHPNETVLDHTRGQGVSGGGTSAVSLSIDLRGTTGDGALDAKIARAGQAILAQVPSVMRDNEKRRN